MKIGVFDSGLGGLIIAKAIMEKMPEYDYVYVGDTLNLPYGGKSREVVYKYSEKIVDYLFKEHNCNLIVIACNTATVCALWRLQQEYLPKNFPNRRILGVIVPTVETIVDRGFDRIGILGTETTIRSKVYNQEIKKVIKKPIKIESVAAPLLVPMIEYEGVRWIKPVVHYYLEFLIQAEVQAVLLGCTHYPYLKNLIRELLPSDIEIISQDEIVPDKLLDYLNRHPEIERKIDKNFGRVFIMTDVTDGYVKNACRLYGQNLDIIKVRL